MSVHVVRQRRETPSARRRRLQRASLRYIRECTDRAELRRELKRGGLNPGLQEAITARLRDLATS